MKPFLINIQNNSSHILLIVFSQYLLVSQVLLSELIFNLHCELNKYAQILIINFMIKLITKYIHNRTFEEDRSIILPVPFREKRI